MTTVCTGLTGGSRLDLPGRRAPARRLAALGRVLGAAFRRDRAGRASGRGADGPAPAAQRQPDFPYPGGAAENTTGRRLGADIMGW
jgi:hypothetical protein